MGIQLNYTTAEGMLRQAVEWANSTDQLPRRWTELTDQLEVASAKTYTPALATALLAKATDDRVDSLSIKLNYASNTYSQRTLCHRVIVPGAIHYGFSIRNTKREPLNNQPFFRYDHISLIDRVRGDTHDQLNEFRSALEELNEYNSTQALAALAAFVRARFKYKPETEPLELTGTVADINWLVSHAGNFLTEAIDRPKCTQALAAATFDTIYKNVKTRGLNDPSRDFPGDVQAFRGKSPVTSMEVRTKNVPETEVKAFVKELRHADISRGFLVVLHSSHIPLQRAALKEWAWQNCRVVLTIIESLTELLWATVTWSPLPVTDVLNKFPIHAAQRLTEIEVHPSSYAKWCDVFK